MAGEGLPVYKDNLIMAGLDGDVIEAFRSGVLRDLSEPVSTCAIRTAPVGLKIVGGLPPKDHATWDWWRRGCCACIARDYSLGLLLCPRSQYR